MSEIVSLDIVQVVRGNNDRTKFDRLALEELAASIREHGLAQPITVRPIEVECLGCERTGESEEQFIHAAHCAAPVLRSRYEIVAGERRFRAVSQIIHRPTIDAIIRELDDEQAAAVMLAENTGRLDLDPIDEALAYQKRVKQFGWTTQEVAERAGVSAIRVCFRIKLLSLRPDVQDLIRNGNLQMGYAQILADAGLDANRQLIAIRYLRDNARPTPLWFRRLVRQLQEEQAQGELFDFGAYTVEVPKEKSEVVEPPHPATTTPPRKGGTLKEIIQIQVDFWTRAAQEWDAWGKPFKRQECEAAAQALSLVLATV